MVFPSTFARMSTTPEKASDSVQKPHFVRRIYDWTLQWADRPQGPLALFLLAAAESSVFPIPPDVLLIALCVGASQKSFRFAFLCTVGSILGGLIGYGIGFWGFEWIGEPIVRFYHGEEVMIKIKDWYDTYGFWGNLIAAITPIPYKVFTIASGAFQFNLGSFLLASVIGRSLRFFAVAGLLYFFGARIKSFIDKYFNALAVIFTILLIGSFILLKYMADK
jgi:membrane protein YqaA with SNARE-associated domain